MSENSKKQVNLSQEINEILEHLQLLRQQIIESRQAISPMEENLKLAKDEFQAAVGFLRRQVLRTQAEIAHIRARIENLAREEETTWEENKPFEPATEDAREFISEPKFQDPDGVEKDILLEHLVMILDDHMNNLEEESLLARIVGLCNDPSVELADVLTELPWGNIWTNASPLDNLASQHRRLSAWAKALEAQLNGLQNAMSNLQNDPRFGLWQQREKGPQAWNIFLQAAGKQLKEQNAELKNELESLQTRWRKLTS